MYDFVPQEEVRSCISVKITEAYPKVAQVVKEFSTEAEMREIGTISGPYEVRDGFAFDIRCNKSMEDVAMMMLALCGINELKHEITL